MVMRVYLANANLKRDDGEWVPDPDAEMCTHSLHSRTGKMGTSLTITAKRRVAYECSQKLGEDLTDLEDPGKPELIQYIMMKIWLE